MSIFYVKKLVRLLFNLTANQILHTSDVCFGLDLGLGLGLGLGGYNCWFVEFAILQSVNHWFVNIFSTFVNIFQYWLTFVNII